MQPTTTTESQQMTADAELLWDECLWCYMRIDPDHAWMGNGAAQIADGTFCSPECGQKADAVLAFSAAKA